MYDLSNTGNVLIRTLFYIKLTYLLTWGSLNPCYCRDKREVCRFPLLVVYGFRNKGQGKYKRKRYEKKLGPD